MSNQLIDRVRELSKLASGEGRQYDDALETAIAEATYARVNKIVDALDATNCNDMIVAETIAAFAFILGQAIQQSEQEYGTEVMGVSLLQAQKWIQRGMENQWLKHPSKRSAA